MAFLMESLTKQSPMLELEVVSILFLVEATILEPRKGIKGRLRKRTLDYPLISSISVTWDGIQIMALIWKMLIPT